MTLKSRLVALYFADTMPTRYWSVWVQLISAIGVARRGDTPSPDLALMFDFAPWWVWSGLLASLAIYRILGLIPLGVTQYTRVIVPLISMSIWVLFIVSAVAAPPYGLSLLFIVLALQDTWILSRAFFLRMHKDD